MEVMAVVGAVTAVAGAASQVKAGKAQQAGYEQQAQQADLRGRAEAIAYKQQGADALANLNQTLAAIIARAGAGGVDPTSGSAQTVAMYAMSQSVTEAQISEDNAALAVGQATQQAGIYRSAGRTARLSANVSAAATLGSAAYSVGQLS